MCAIEISSNTNIQANTEYKQSEAQPKNNTEFADNYKKALANEESSYIELMFEDEANPDVSNKKSKKNKKAIANTEKSVENSADDKKMHKKAAKKAEGLIDSTFGGHSVKKAKAKGNKVNIVYYLDENNKKTGKGTIEYGKDGSKIITLKEKDKTLTKIIDSDGTIRQKTTQNTNNGFTEITEYNKNGKVNRNILTDLYNDGYKRTTIYNKDGEKSYIKEKDGNTVSKTMYVYGDEGEEEGPLGTFQTLKNTSSGEKTKVYTLYDDEAKFETTKNADGELSTKISFAKLFGGYDDTNAVNGQLDNKIKQGQVGDCWLLSALNSLNTTQIGKNIIQDTIKQNADGSVEINFKGVNKSYTIPVEEMIEKRKDYSHGDNDAFVIELAAEKLRCDIQSGKIVLDEGLDCISKSALNPEKGLKSGISVEGLYYLTGIEGNVTKNPMKHKSEKQFNN